MRNLMTQCVAIVVMGGASLAAAGEPVGWRTDGTGAYPDANPPIKWSADTNVVWKTEMPSSSNSTPIVVGDKLFVCGDENILICVDAGTGKVAWTGDSSDAAEGDKPRAHKANGYSTPTPTSDGEHVFAVFGTGVVAAYTVDGERLWARTLEKPKRGWGHSASPLLVDGKLIIHILDVVALDPKTGKEVWRTAAPEAWGSPIAVNVGGAGVIVTPSGSFIRASDGKLLASGVAEAQYAAPVAVDGVVYFIAKSGRARAVKLPAKLSGDTIDLRVLWTKPIKGDRHYASSVVHGGLIYCVSRDETYSVLDAKTGDVVHEIENITGGGGRNSAYPSVALAGGRVFVSNQAGNTVVIQPGREHKQLASNTLEGFRSSPVFVGDRVYIRTFKHLYCIGPAS